MDKAQESKTYHRIKNQLFFVGLGVDIIFLIVVTVSGLSVGLRNFAANVSSHFFILNGIYTFFLAVGMYLLHFPLGFFEGFIWEHRFRLSRQKFLHWLGDDLKKAAINGIVMLIAIEVIYALLRRFPDTWWIGAGLFWLFLNLVLSQITPRVIIPLFYKYSVIENQELKDCILKLFETAHIKIKDAYAINFSAKTKKANAFICGLGESRRVVLSDTLLDEFSIPEIETVVAHEIGHYKHHDILKLTVIHSLVVFCGFFLIRQFLQKALGIFGLAHMDDIAFLPVVALAFIIFGFLMMPLLNSFSRKLEVKADDFSLKLTQRPQDFISMIKKLGMMNLAEFEPNAFIEMLFYSHPPIAKRIKFAESFSLES